jgi:hypothetical protein
VGEEDVSHERDGADLPPSRTAPPAPSVTPPLDLPAPPRTVATMLCAANASAAKSKKEPMATNAKPITQLATQGGGVGHERRRPERGMRRGGAHSGWQQ